MTRLFSVLAICAALAACGSTPAGIFECTASSQCAGTGGAGQCVEGYCAFDKDGCLRWDDTAGPRKGTCVPADDMARAPVVDMAEPAMTPDLSMPSICLFDDEPGSRFDDACLMQ